MPVAPDSTKLVDALCADQAKQVLATVRIALEAAGNRWQWLAVASRDWFTRVYADDLANCLTFDAPQAEWTGSA